MLYFALAASLMACALAVYSGIRGTRMYSAIIRTGGGVAFSEVLKTAAWFGATSCLAVYALLSLGGTIMDKKLNWSFSDMASLAIVSVFAGFLVGLGVTYQVYTTIKYKDWLRKKVSTKDKNRVDNVPLTDPSKRNNP